MTATSSSPEDAARQDEANRRRGRPVPWVIAAFYVSFMSALIGFVVIAYHNPPNEVTSEAYEKGLSYNATIAEADTQKALGWTSHFTYAGNTATFALRDRDGKALDGAEAVAWFVHPERSALDRKVTLRSLGGGLYAETLVLPSNANWTVHVTAARDGQQYQYAGQVDMAGR